MTEDPADLSDDPDLPPLGRSRIEKAKQTAAQPGLLERVRKAFRAEEPEPEIDLFDEDEVTPIPPPPEGWTEVEVRALVAPFTHVRILHSEETNEHRYEVLEPPLDDAEQRLYGFIREAFLRTVDVDVDALERAGPRAYLRKALDRVIRDHDLTVPALSRARVLYYVERDLLGFGPLDPFMHDPMVEDVSCDGPEVPLYVYHRRHESLRSNVVFPSHEVLNSFVMELVQRAGKQISVSDPLVDATLPDGSRLQATLAREVTTRGSTFTVRRFREDPMTPIDLLELGTLNSSMLAYFWMAVQYGASGIFAGGTASGKTTALNAIGLFIPPQMKIVSIEDTREINLPHENWIPGVTRGGTQGAEKRRGDVDMYDLLRAALRQRPEYILVGEIRGREGYVLFQAMTTGHTVYSTMHADSASAAVYRLEAKPIEIPRVMLNALDFIAIQVQTRVQGRRVRRIQEIVEFTGIDARTNELLTNTVFRWESATDKFRDSGHSDVLDEVARATGRPIEEVRSEFQRRKRLLEAAAARGIRDYRSFAALVTSYLANPDRALGELGLEGA